MYIDRLSKEERKNMTNEFLSKEESVVYKKAQRVFIMSLLGIIFGVFVTAFDITRRAGIAHYVLDGALLIFVIIFAYKTHNMKRVELNKYALKKKDGKEKKKK